MQRETQELIAEYNAYPAALRPEALVKDFSKLLTDNTLPWLKIDQSGTSPLSVVDGQPSSSETDLPDVLTAIVRVTMAGEFKPEILILSAHLYRPGYSDCSPQSCNDGAIAIPINSSSSEVTARVNYFEQHAAIGKAPPLKQDRRY